MQNCCGNFKITCIRKIFELIYFCNVLFCFLQTLSTTTLRKIANTVATQIPAFALLGKSVTSGQLIIFTAVNLFTVQCTQSWA
jgi:hypothetical protein